MRTNWLMDLKIWMFTFHIGFLLMKAFVFFVCVCASKKKWFVVLPDLRWFSVLHKYYFNFVVCLLSFIDVFCALSCVLSNPVVSKLFVTTPPPVLKKNNLGASPCLKNVSNLSVEWLPNFLFNLYQTFNIFPNLNGRVNSKIFHKCHYELYFQYFVRASQFRNRWSNRCILSCLSN